MVNERIEIWNTQRIDPTTNLPNEDLKPYLCKYYSAEVGAVYEVTLEEGQNGKINEFLLQDRRGRNLQFVKE